MIGAFLAAGVGFLAFGGQPAAPDNPVLRENALPGTALWQPFTSATTAIEGYASAVGALPGSAVQLHVSTNPAERYRIEVFRLGWYRGDGGRRIACIPRCDGDEQGAAQPLPPRPARNPHSEPVRAGWRVTDVLTVGGDWVSGYYLIRFVLTSGPQAGRYSWTFLVVREPEGRRSQILVQVPTNTWEAYNAWGGKSLYDTTTRTRSYRVSFDRPYDVEAQSPFWYEIQLVRFLEREGYDVSYQTDLETHRDPPSLRVHRLVITSGHDEYWTKEIRDGFESAREAGVNLAFMGSNTGYWQIRYEDDGRTVFGYKSLYDPEPNPALKTAMFRDVGRPECELLGVQHQFILPPQYGPHDYSVTEAARDDPWFAGTALAPGDRVVDVLGPEYDVINPWPDTCQHPGLKVLFHFQGYPTMQNGDAVRYTAPSGARVFVSGAQRFSWALDTWGTVQLGHTAPANPGVQQFMRNALNDLTRPAPPSRLDVRVGRHRIGLWVHQSSDLQVRSVRIYAHGGPGAFDVATARLVCESASFRCLTRIPPHAPARMTFAAVLVDAWSTSEPVFSDTVDVPRLHRHGRSRGRPAPRPW